MPLLEFDHEYQSCERTYATLCIYSDSLHAAQISKVMDQQPDDFLVKGEQRRPGKTNKSHLWQITTQGDCESKDMRAHVFFLLSNIPDGAVKLKALIELGCEIRLWSFWESASGNGGPTLDHEFVKWLSQYPVELAFDFYDSSDD
jgi:hypothetical protein